MYLFINLLTPFLFFDKFSTFFRIIMKYKEQIFAPSLIEIDEVIRGDLF